jgi:hypothetical protein
MDKETIDQNNFNAWRRTVTPGAEDYTSQGPEKDNAAIQWAKDNGYDNSKVYTTPAVVPPVTQTPEVSPTTPPTVAEVAKQSADTGKSFVQMYHDNIAPPAYDAQRANSLKTNANLSVVGDVAKLISEGITTSQGGKVIPRQSQAPQLNTQLQQLNDVYKRDAQAYKANGFQYMLADEKDKRATAARMALQARQDAINAQHQANSDRTFNQSQTNADRAHELQVGNSKRADKSFNNTVRHDKVMENKAEKDPNEEKNFHIIIDGKSVPVPSSYINDVAGRAKLEAKNATDPIIAMTPSEAFTAKWNKYYEYTNGQLTPKRIAPVVTSPVKKSAFVPGGANSVVSVKPNSKTIKGFNEKSR